MVKWYNESLPRISREFDSPWPHQIKHLRLPKVLLLTVKNIKDVITQKI